MKASMTGKCETLLWLLVKVMIFTFCFSWYGIQSYGQKSIDVDSVEQVISQLDSLSNAKVDLLNRLASHYSFKDSSLLYKYANQAIRLSQYQAYPEGEINARYQLAGYLRISARYKSALEEYIKVEQMSDSVGYLRGVAKARSGLGQVYFVTGDFLQSIALYEGANEINRSIDNLYGLANNYEFLSIVLTKTGRSDKALEYMLKSIKVYEELELESSLVSGYLNLGVFYYNQNEPRKALLNYKESLRRNVQVDSEPTRAVCFNNIGLIYEESNQLDSAENFYAESIRIGERLKFKRLLGWSYNGMAKVEQKRGDYIGAKGWIDKAMAIRESAGNGFELAKTYVTLGDNNSLQGKDYLAFSNYRRALELGIQANDAIGCKDVLMRLAALSDKMDWLEQSYDYRRQYIEMDDSLAKAEQVKKIAFLEAQYKFEAKKDSISFTQQQEKLLLEHEIQKGKFLQWTLAIVLLFVIGIAFIVFYYLSKLRKSSAKMKLLNEELNLQHQKLREQNELKARLFTIISGDLRLPLNGLFAFGYKIKNHIQANHDHKLDPVFASFNYAHSNAEQLMDNVLNWGLIDAGVEKLEFQEISLDEVVTRCMKIYAPYAASKSIEFHFNPCASETKINGDLASVQMIIRNLISNAIKFTNRGGDVDFTLLSKENKASLSIKDTGVGMTEQQLKKLFIIDQDKSNAGTEGERGTGLGLKLVYDFMQLNNGIIDVQSEVGRGTTFLLTFNT